MPGKGFEPTITSTTRIDNVNNENYGYEGRMTSAPAR